jgi:hypothetical protein
LSGKVRRGTIHRVVPSDSIVLTGQDDEGF